MTPQFYSSPPASSIQFPNELPRLGQLLDDNIKQEDNFSSVDDFDLIMKQSDKIVSEIVETRAYTIEGIAVKIRALKWILGDETVYPLDVRLGRITDDERLASSIINDLLAMFLTGRLK